MVDVGSILWHVEQADGHLADAESMMGNPAKNPDHTLRLAELHLRIAESYCSMRKFTMAEVSTRIG